MNQKIKTSWKDNVSELRTIEIYFLEKLYFLSRNIVPDCKRKF